MKLAPAQMAGAEARSGRGDRFRTRDLRIWSPLLYQLSYSPKAHANHPDPAREGGSGRFLSLAFAVEAVAPTETAVLLEF